ncbi:MAG: hypothetical protein Q7S28_04135, partial [bacterium]|nr:hypothetical protein [bacterium]
MGTPILSPSAARRLSVLGQKVKASVKDFAKKKEVLTQRAEKLDAEMRIAEIRKTARKMHMGMYARLEIRVSYGSTYFFELIHSYRGNPEKNGLQYGMLLFKEVKKLFAADGFFLCLDRSQPKPYDYGRDAEYVALWARMDWEKVSPSSGTKAARFMAEAIEKEKVLRRKAEVERKKQEVEVAKQFRKKEIPEFYASYIEKIRKAAEKGDRSVDVIHFENSPHT